MSLVQYIHTKQFLFYFVSLCCLQSLQVDCMDFAGAMKREVELYEHMQNETWTERGIHALQDFDTPAFNIAFKRITSLAAKKQLAAIACITRLGLDSTLNAAIANAVYTYYGERDANAPFVEVQRLGDADQERLEKLRFKHNPQTIRWYNLLDDNLTYEQIDLYNQIFEMFAQNNIQGFSNAIRRFSKQLSQNENLRRELVKLLPECTGKREKLGPILQDWFYQETENQSWAQRGLHALQNDQTLLFAIAFKRITSLKAKQELCTAACMYLGLDLTSDQAIATAIFAYHQENDPASALVDLHLLREGDKKLLDDLRLRYNLQPVKWQKLFNYETPQKHLQLYNQLYETFAQNDVRGFRTALQQFHEETSENVHLFKEIIKLLPLCTGQQETLGAVLREFAIAHLPLGLQEELLNAQPRKRRNSLVASASKVVQILNQNLKKVPEPPDDTPYAQLERSVSCPVSARDRPTQGHQDHH